MGKLLIDEQPLQCLPSLAAVLGSSDEAIVLQQLHYWLSRTNNVQSDGHKWVYNSMADWLKQFPWINSRNTLSGYFNDLEKRGLVITGNFNKVKFDRTKWYRINYDALTDLEQRLSEKHSSNAQKLSNGMPNDCASNDQELGNGTSKNEATYTNRLPETTTREDDDDAHTRDAQPADEDPFTLANQANINVNSALNLHVFVDFIDTLGAPVVCWAIRRTNDKASRPNWSYLLSVMKDLEANSVRTVEQAEELSAQHRKQTAKAHSRPRYGHQHIEEPLPDWAKKQNKPKKRPSKAFFDSLYDDEEG